MQNLTLDDIEDVDEHELANEEEVLRRRRERRRQ